MSPEHAEAIACCCSAFRRAMQSGIGGARCTARGVEFQADGGVRLKGATV